MAKVAVKFEMEKDTKNTIRFKEVVADMLDTPKVGTVYVPKSTLKEIGYEAGKQLTMELSI